MPRGALNFLLIGEGAVDYGLKVGGRMKVAAFEAAR